MVKSHSKISIGVRAVRNTDHGALRRRSHPVQGSAVDITILVASKCTTAPEIGLGVSRYDHPAGRVARVRAPNPKQFLVGCPVQAKLERGFSVVTAAIRLYERKSHSRPKEGLEWGTRN